MNQAVVMDDKSPAMPPVTRRERLSRTRRAFSPKVWRSVVFGLTEPANDWHWEFVAKRDTDTYLSAPIPWLAQGAVYMLDERLSSENRVFEWGAGASTLWLMSRAGGLLSYETDAEWVEAIRPRLNDRCEIHAVSEDDPDYCTADLTGFDVVLIDAMRRTDCARHVGDTAEPGTLVIFDDSERSAHIDGAQLLSRRATEQWHYPALTAMMTPNLTSVYLLG